MIIDSSSQKLYPEFFEDIFSSVCLLSFFKIYKLSH